MIALYSVTLRIMGRPNIALITEPTVLTPFEPYLSVLWLRPLLVACVLAVVLALLGRFLLSEAGLAMRAVGVNPRMAEAQGAAGGAAPLLGMSLANAPARP